MNLSDSSCEIASPPSSVSEGSRVIRFQPDYRWQGVPVAEYKQPADHWCGISRIVLIGERGESAPFHVRYFEIAPGGFSTLEEHAHEHAVVILRGRGQVQLGERVYDLSFGDTVYVAPHELHQFRNPSGPEPFGFLCIVNAKR
jgi:ribulose-bisphosphate carboxylase large chain